MKPVDRVKTFIKAYAKGKEGHKIVCWNKKKIELREKGKVIKGDKRETLLHILKDIKTCKEGFKDETKQELTEILSYIKGRVEVKEKGMGKVRKFFARLTHLFQGHGFKLTSTLVEERLREVFSTKRAKTDKD